MYIDKQIQKENWKVLARRSQGKIAEISSNLPKNPINQETI
jgi:hypothetical protein